MNLNMLCKNALQLEGEMLLSLDEIAKIYTIPTVVMNSLFFSEYVNKNCIKENTDYYLIPKEIYSVFNITSVKTKEIFISITGFIQISLELIKSANGTEDRKIKEELLKFIVSKFFYSSNSNNIKFTLEKTKEDKIIKEEKELPIEKFYPRDNAVLSLRKQCNTAISILVRNTKYSFEEIRNKIYSNIDLKCGVKLESRLANMKDRAKISGLSKTKIKNLNYLDVILADKALTSSLINEILNIGRHYNITLGLGKVA